MTYATESIDVNGAKFDYDPINECIIELTTGQVVYHETGIGEIDIRDVMRGEVYWQDPQGNDILDRPFTFDDFVSEIIMPDLYAAGLVK